MFTGQGLILRTPALASVLQLPLRALARAESFAPTRSSRTPPVVVLGTFLAGGAKSFVRAHPATLAVTRKSPSRRHFRVASSRGASRKFPRRNLRSTAPEVPSVLEPPLRGAAFFPQDVCSLWIGGQTPLRSPLLSPQRRIERESGDSASSACGLGSPLLFVRGPPEFAGGT